MSKHEKQKRKIKPLADFLKQIEEKPSSIPQNAKETRSLQTEEPEHLISRGLEIISKHFPDFVIYSNGDAPFWDGVSRYNKGDLVEYQNAAFIATSDNQGEEVFKREPGNPEPKLNASFWQIYCTPNRHIIEALILYFCQSPEFEKIDWITNPSLKKGLRFSGNVGTGKSRTLKLFFDLCRNIDEWESFALFNCRAVVRSFKENEFSLSLHGVGSYSKDWREEKRRPISRAYDGFGEEIQRGEVNNYGTKTNVMQEVLLDRYDFLVEDGMKTFITTNLTLNEVEDLYSTMLADRFKQMFNNIVFTGLSLRK